MEVFLVFLGFSCREVCFANLLLFGAFRIGQFYSSPHCFFGAALVDSWPSEAAVFWIASLLGAIGLLRVFVSPQSVQKSELGAV